MQRLGSHEGGHWWKRACVQEDNGREVSVAGGKGRMVVTGAALAGMHASWQNVVCWWRLVLSSGELFQYRRIGE